MEPNINLTKWPLFERPREKLAKYGVRSLSDSELIAIFLQTGIKGHSALSIAKQILSHFKGLRKFLEASPEELIEIKGLGKSKICLIQSVMELGRRYLEAKVVRNSYLSHTNETMDYLTAELKAYSSEVFACLFLDSKHQIICFEKLFHGTIHHTTIHPREIIKRALYHNAAALIFSHNHPSGHPTPSPADIEMTLHLKTILSHFDIKVLDHIIVGESYAISLAQRGMM